MPEHQIAFIGATELRGGFAYNIDHLTLALRLAIGPCLLGQFDIVDFACCYARQDDENIVGLGRGPIAVDQYISRILAKAASSFADFD